MNRALVIASVLAILVLAGLAAEIARFLLAVPPMPEEMVCVIKRNCPSIDPIPVAPLTAPRLSDIKRTTSQKTH
jgi:hypothetical protein